MRISKLVVVMLVLFAISFTVGILLSRKHKLSTGNCIDCHAHIVDSDKLSAKARGKSGIIFFHSTHNDRKLSLSCVDCHSANPHHGKRPVDSYCLQCHTGIKDDDPPNACEVCHANTDQLKL